LGIDIGISIPPTARRHVRMFNRMLGFRCINDIPNSKVGRARHYRRNSHIDTGTPIVKKAYSRSGSTRPKAAQTPGAVLRARVIQQYFYLLACTNKRCIQPGSRVEPITADGDCLATMWDTAVNNRGRDAPSSEEVPASNNTPCCNTNTSKHLSRKSVQFQIFAGSMAAKRPGRTGHARRRFKALRKGCYRAARLRSRVSD
jgi:hypothetical protein